MKTPILAGPGRIATATAFSTASVTRYLQFGHQLLAYDGTQLYRSTEGAWRFEVAADGVIDDWEMYFSESAVNTRTSATTFTLMKNGVSTGYSLTVGAGVNGWVGASGGPVTVAAGDLLSIRMVTGAGSGSISPLISRASFEADSGATVAHFCTGGAYGQAYAPSTSRRSGPVAGTVESNGFGDYWGAEVSAANWQARVGTDATAVFARIDIPVNASTVGLELELFVNNAASGLVISIPAATTGAFSVTGAVDLAPGDLLDWRRRATGAGTGNYQTGNIQLALEYDGNAYDLWSLSRGNENFLGLNDTTYHAGFPQLANSSSEPSGWTRVKLFGGTVGNLWAYVSNAGGGVGNYPVSEVRKNGAALGLGLTISGAAGAVRYVDTVNTAVLADGDRMAYAFRTTAFSQTLASWGVTIFGAAADVVIEVPAGELLITGQAPVVTAPVLIPIGAGSLLIEGQAPAILEGTATFIPAGELVLQGQAPLVSTETAALASEQALLLLGALDPAARADQQAVLLLGEIVPDVAASQQAVLVLAEGSPCITERCQIWTITRRDGEVFRYTSLDRDLVYGNAVYSSCRSLDPSASENASTLGSTGNIELTGIIDDDGISEADLYGGKFDDAYVTVDLVAWGAQAESPHRLAAGWTGTLSQGETGFEMEVLGPGSRLDQQALVQMVTPSCRWTFGDARCGVDIDALAIEGVVTVASSRGRFLAVLDGVSGASQWENGTVRWTAGVNAGQTVEVKTVDFDSGEVTLWAAPAYVPEPGDAFDLLPGCDKAREGGCSVYANVINHGGFPDVPGADSLLETPDAQY